MTASNLADLLPPLPPEDLAPVIPLRGRVIDKEALKPCLTMGFDLIPIKPWDSKHKGRPAGKMPRDKEWVVARYDRAALINWIKKGGNVGVRLTRSQVVIDIDPKHEDAQGRSAEELCDELELELGVDLSTAPVVETGSGGWHVYLSKPEDKRVRNTVDLFGGAIEFKSYGRQVLAAGSKHPSGAFYRWLRNEGADLPPCPGPLLELIAKPDIQERERSDEECLSTQQLRECLEQLDPTQFRDYEAWRNLMFSVHYACGGAIEGRDLFIGWSTSDPKYRNAGESIQELWDYASDNRSDARTEKTLYYYVLQSGGTVPLNMEALDDIEQPEQESNEAEAQPSRFAFLSVEECIQEIKPAAPIVDGLLHEGVAILLGKWGLGKTYVALSLALAVAYGRDKWLGERLYLSGKVVYLALEGPYVFPTRLRAWLQHHGESERSDQFRLYPGAANLTSDADRRDLLASLKAEGPALVILDTLSAATPGADENSAKDMGPVIDYALRIRRETGATVVLIHHPPKDGSSTARGSGVIEANVDGTLELRAAAGGSLELRAPKVRAAKPAPPLRLALRDVGLGEDPDRPGRPISDAVMVRVEGAALSEGDRVRGIARQAAVEAGGAVPLARVVPLVQRALGLGTTQARERLMDAVPKATDPERDPFAEVFRERKGGEHSAWMLRLEDEPE